jgi:hypothetical protein
VVITPTLDDFADRRPKLPIQVGVNSTERHPMAHCAPECALFISQAQTFNHHITKPPRGIQSSL